MKVMPVLFVILFSSLASAMISYTVDYDQNGQGIIQAAFHSSGFHEQLFVGKTIKQAFAFFGEATVNQIESSINVAMTSNLTVPVVTYFHQDLNEEFEANFVKSISHNGKTTVTIFIDPKEP